MNKKLKLNKSWKGHASGTILEVDEATVNEIVEEKAGEIYDDSAEVVQKTAKDAVAKNIAEALGPALEAKLKEMASDSSKMIHISVKDKSDDDPTFGYLPGNTKSMDELSKGEVHFAFGRFATDVARAARGHESETLVKCRQRSKELVQKAAGTGLVAGSDEDGGYLIFSAASQLINTAALENAVVRSRATHMTLGSQLLMLPYMRDVSHSTGTVFGGIQIYFDDELAQYTESRPKMAQIELKLKKMTALGFVSDEWVKWSPVSMGSWLIPKFGEAMGWKEDSVFLAGKGGGQPLGVLNAKCAISISGETNQDANSLVLENSTKMYARLRVLKEGSVVWLMNRTVFPQLPLFNITAGTGGSPVFTNNVGDAPGQKLWGYPIVWTEKVPALGTAGCVTLTDLSDYIVADDQSGPEVAQSTHLKFDYGQQAFRITKYIDGQNTTDSALTPLNGDTLSPVVKLPAI